jgi:hypothetical protein
MKDKLLSVSIFRKQVFGPGYVSDRLQAAHQRSLASSSSADDSEIFNRYMKDLRVQRVARTKAVPR